MRNDMYIKYCLNQRNITISTKQYLYNCVQIFKIMKIIIIIIIILCIYSDWNFCLQVWFDQ